MKNRSRIPTTLSIGAILGTLTAATMFVGAGVLVMFIFPVLIVPYVAWCAWAWFLQSRGCVPELSGLTALLLVLIAVPVSVYLPYHVASIEMKARAADTPMPENLPVYAIVPDPIGNSSTGPGVIFRLQADESVLENLRVYSNELEEQGWSKVAGDVPTAVGFNVSLLFADSDYGTLFLRATWNRTLHRYEGVSVRLGLSSRVPVVILVVLAAAFVLPLVFCAFRTRSNRDDHD